MAESKPYSGDASRSWKEGMDFKVLLASDLRVTECVNPEELDRLFDLEPYLEHVDYVYKRVFGA